MIKFAIIGAPRSGTSSLFNWLNDHPQLHGSSPKEPFYFMDPEHPLAGRTGKSFHTDGFPGYNTYFSSRDCLLYKFEGTTHTYYQKTAYENFSKMEPLPFVFLIMRRPSERIVSSFYYSQNVIGTINKKMTFSVFVDHLLDNSMSRIQKYFHTISAYRMACLELEIGIYINWIKIWQAFLGADHVKSYIFDDLVNNPFKIVGSICNVLKIDNSSYANYGWSIFNKAHIIRNFALHKYFSYINNLFPFKKIKLIKNLYNFFQHERILKNNMDDEALQRLDDYYQPFNLQLSKHLNIDLSCWSIN